MGKLTTIKHRNYNDFKYNSFIVFVNEKEVVIRGKLKNNRSNSFVKYMEVKTNAK